MIYPLIAFLLLYLLWIFYLAVMNLSRAKKAKTLKKPVLYLALPILWIGLILDVMSNIFVMTILMLELPRELLVTQRLQRHYQKDTWRGRFAGKFSEYLLDPFDPSGNHID